MQLPRVQAPAHWMPVVFSPGGMNAGVEPKCARRTWQDANLRYFTYDAQPPPVSAVMRARLIRLCGPFALAALLLVAPLAWAFASPDEDDDMPNSDQYQTEAAFLFNFAKFVEWPPHKFTQPDSPLIIGVVGTDPFGGLLEEAVQDQRINDRTVMIRHIESKEELGKCEILFVCRSESDRLGPILDEVHGDNVLTATATDSCRTAG
jgi:hypothetical protein